MKLGAWGWAGLVAFCMSGPMLVYRISQGEANRALEWGGIFVVGLGIFLLQWKFGQDQVNE